MRFISIEKEKRKNILENKIDANNYLSINKDRGTLIKLGIALGLENPKPLKSKDNLFRPEYVRTNPELQAIIACAAIERMKNEEELEKVLDETYMFNISDECLNEGLEIIAEQIDNMPLSGFRLNLIEELEKLYYEKVE